MRRFQGIFAAFFAVIALAGCGGGESATGDSAAAGGASGEISLDGSSTVFPITEAIAEEFRRNHPGARVSIGVSGTGGGFKKFCAGETDIQNASRIIKESEIAACAEAGIEWIELPVAYDGLAVVVNPENDWVNMITVEELRTIWEPAAQGEIMRWSDVRPGWPDTELHLYGPGVDSGTFDYFTLAINGEEGASRGDFTASEDDNVLVQGIANDRNALGFFGFAYYDENRSRLKIVPVDDGDASNGAGAIVPSIDTVRNSTYQPLSRPIFIYVRKDALEEPVVAEFIDFYLENAEDLVGEVGYIPLPANAYRMAQARVDDRITGSMFEDAGSQVGVSIEDLLNVESRSAAPDRPAETTTTE
ncbi:MAG: PstS family phosphate ABC transporter substrate-binding protein [Acidobacteria bacterium]|nr:PstS family phosphate ABC transporter substrate-binding protein [Acidobacteriota bacterium]